MALSKKAIITLAGAGAALAVGLTIPTVALAQEPSPSPSASAGPGTSGDREARRTERRQALAEGLAKELGIEQSKVEAALEKVETELQADAKTDRLARLKEELDQAVEDGKLTQAQADAVLKATEAGVLPGRGGRGYGGGIPR